VKCLSDSKLRCDSDCLGFKARKICSHVVAVGFKTNQLSNFLSSFKSTTKAVNLTSLTTHKVNRSAGLKRSRAPTRPRQKSPDNMSSARKDSGKVTLGDLFCNPDDHYTAEASEDPLKVTLRKKTPPKPELAPTTTTPYQLIDITGRIRKCAGCGGKLEDGPDPFSCHELDAKLCIRHKEHDFFWINSTRQWKKTFDNKHYHVFVNCIRSRNGDTFNVSCVDISLNHTLGQNEIGFLHKRFPSL